MSCSFNSSCSPHSVILLPTPLRKKLPGYWNLTIDMKKYLEKQKKQIEYLDKRMGKLNNFKGEILAD